MKIVDKLIGLTKRCFQNRISDNRRRNSSFAMPDILQGALAMFHLKDPSLLIFRQNMVERAENLRKLYKINALPEDSALREALDVVDWRELHQTFSYLWTCLLHKKDLSERRVLGEYLAFAADGTAHFASGKLKNKHSMTKQHTNKKGEISYSYYHQALAAVQVCPGQAAVFPMAIEPICNADGSTKNDCEQNTLKRLLPKIRELMPSEQLIGVYDALAANGPAIRAFNSEKIKYIITMKDGYVLHQIAALKQENSDKLNTHTWTTDTAKCTATYTSKLILNGSNLDIFVNYLEFTEICLKTDEITYQNAWITDLSLAQDMLQEFVAVARSRWKVENETFNTLKNQGYHLEHNYGVGKHFLATNFMLLAFIAFFIDQIALYCDTNFAKALSSAKSFKRLWERIRQFMDLTIAPSFDAIYRVIAKLDAFVKPILV